MTDVEIELIPIETVFAASICFDAEHIEPALRRYASWVAALTNEATSSIAICRLPDDSVLPEVVRGRTVAYLRFVNCHDGSATDGDSRAQLQLAPMLDIGGIVHQEVGRRSYSELGDVHRDPTMPAAMWQRSGQLRARDGALPDETVDVILEVAGSSALDAPGMIEVRHLGGALRRPQRSPNAVAGRCGDFNLLLVSLGPPGEHDARTVVGDASYSRVQPLLNGRGLASWLGNATTSDAVIQAWDPNTRRRLLAVKERLDPQNVFRFGHPVKASPRRAGESAHAGL